MAQQNSSEKMLCVNLPHYLIGTPYECITCSHLYIHFFSILKFLASHLIQIFG